MNQLFIKKAINTMNFYRNNVTSCSAIADFNMALYALRKQFPMAVKKKSGETGYYKCPNCKKTEIYLGVGHEKDMFCHLCGQAISWEVEE